ncbi:MAG: CoA-binding protein [Deinococcota bacterium]
MAILQDTAAVRDVLRNYRTVAVIGAHVKPSKPAHYVPQYLHDHGYTILPVNPVYEGEILFNRAVTSNLAEAAKAYSEQQPTKKIEVVNVFRRSEQVAHHLDEMLELAPKLVWLQLGIRNDDVAHALNEAGIDVIQDRCMLADHRVLIGKGVTST